MSHEARRRVSERLAQHRENLRLWLDGSLDPTEPDPHERECVVRELRACIAELEALHDLLSADEAHAGRRCERCAVTMTHHRLRGYQCPRGCRQ